jgi:hypothetical protein
LKRQTNNFNNLNSEKNIMKLYLVTDNSNNIHATENGRFIGIYTSRDTASDVLNEYEKNNKNAYCHIEYINGSNKTLSIRISEKDIPAIGNRCDEFSLSYDCELLSQQRLINHFENYWYATILYLNTTINITLINSEK